MNELDRLRQRIKDATLAQQWINGSPEVEDLVLVSYRGDDYRGELSAKIAANEVFKLTSDGNASVEIGPVGVTLWVTHPEGKEDYLDTWARVDGFCSYAAVYKATRQCQGMAIRTPAYQSSRCLNVQETTEQMSLGLEILKTKLRMLELRTK